MMKFSVVGLLTLLVALVSCRPSVPVPKPKGYFKLEFPKHAYQQFDSAGFPYTFEYPVYGEIRQDEDPEAGQAKSPYWIHIAFPGLNAAIYLSYKQINATQSLGQLVNESYKLSYAHDIRADYIKAPDFTTPNGLVGVYYSVGGDAASAYQFFITDTVAHFVRGALYFNATPNADSLQPGIEFLKADIDHMIQTFRFRNGSGN